MNLAHTIAQTQVTANQVALFWLGQAGFLMKDQAGHQLVIDPYLTDCGERLKGFKRLSPKLLAPEDLDPDIYFVSHYHFDHYDYDAVPVVAQSSKTIFCGPPSCTPLLKKDGVSADRIYTLEPNQTLTHNSITITAVKADHGTLAPDALGVFVVMGGCRLFFSGDTAYHREYIPIISALAPDVAVMSINGMFGNMTAAEGASFAEEIKAKLAIPCHFWTFLEHRGAPWDFMNQLADSAICRPVCLSHGEALIVDSNSGT